MLWLLSFTIVLCIVLLVLLVCFYADDVKVDRFHCLCFCNMAIGKTAFCN